MKKVINLVSFWAGVGGFSFPSFSRSGFFFFHLTLLEDLYVPAGCNFSHMIAITTIR